MRPWFACLVCLLLCPSAVPAAARKIMVMGDSQSEEYAFEVGPAPGFAGPDSNPTAANIRNWVEILAAARPADITFGSYKSNLLGYSDLRNGGYAYNWSVPGFTTSQFVDVVQASLLSNPGYLTSKNQLVDQLKNEVAYVAVVLGANDVRSRYGDYYNNTVPAGYSAGIVANLKTLVDFIQAQKSSLRILIATIPDPGVTPAKIADHPDAAKRAAASARIASLNANITALAASEGCALADLFALTERIRTEPVFHLNGTAFLKSGHPENPPLHLFAKDGFHPATAAQSQFANTIVTAINTRWGQSIPPLAGRTVLADVLGLDPDQPLHDWLAAHGAATGGFADDADGDGFTNGMEFALGGNPAVPDVPAREIVTGPRGGVPSLILRYPAGTTRDGYLLGEAGESPSLPAGWTTVPAARTSILPGGGIEAWRPLTGPAGFLRIGVRPAP